MPRHLSDLLPRLEPADAEALARDVLAVQSGGADFQRSLRPVGARRVLLVQRNRAFAAGIEQLLNGDGVSFVAVGAAHLVGPDSVVADLAKDGITAVRQ